MECDVVMVAKLNTPELIKMTDDCIASLHASESEIKFNVILEVDDGTRTFNYNRFLADGIQKGTNEWVIMANNDLKFHDGWMTEIIKVQDSVHNKMSFGCWNPGYHEKYFKSKMNCYYGYGVCYEITGWILVTTREVLDKIDFCNKANQRVSFWRSDFIYAELLQNHNITHLLCRNSKVTHLLSQTLKKQSKERQKELTYTQREIYKSL